MSDLSHLPADIRAALDAYDKKVATGQLTFSAGEFADEPADTMGGWVQAPVASHLSVFDSGEVHDAG